MPAASDECFILIKAQPHRSSKYFETVCCAGVGRDRKWRRQYPVPFRILNDSQQFKRWNWIEYTFTKSDSDPRKESQKVVPESLRVTGAVPVSERASFLEPLIRGTFAEANDLRESLTLIRPRKFSLAAYPKSKDFIEREANKHRDLANQISMFDRTAKPLKPCSMRFVARWEDQDGNARAHECDDWETSAAFNRFESMYGQKGAVRALKENYDKYMDAGMVLGFSTHKRRNAEFGTSNQWLLVGMIRLDVVEQNSFAF